MKITIDYVRDQSKIYGYELLSEEYKNAKEKLHFKCDKGHDCYINWNNFKSGKRCKDCSNQNKAKALRHSYDYVKNFYEEHSYKLIDKKYVNELTHLETICPNGHLYRSTFNTFKKSVRCPCNNKTRGVKHTYEYVYNYIKSNNYLLLSKNYVNSYTKLEIKCENNHIYLGNFHNFKSGYRCPYCNESKGEKRIAEFLNKKEIKYEREKTFKDCKNKRLLPFDFYLTHFNLLIEYDGIQHFEPKECFGDIEQFHLTQKNDFIKNEYAKRASIPLIRISYKDFDKIETILEEILYRYGEPSTTIP